MFVMYMKSAFFGKVFDELRVLNEAVSDGPCYHLVVDEDDIALYRDGLIFKCSSMVVFLYMLKEYKQCMLL